MFEEGKIRAFGYVVVATNRYTSGTSISFDHVI